VPFDIVEHRGRTLCLCGVVDLVGLLVPSTHHCFEDDLAPLDDVRDAGSSPPLLVGLRIREAMSGRPSDFGVVEPLCR
jgi:hypothetical protein